MNAVELPAQLREQSAKYFALPSTMQCESLGSGSHDVGGPVVLFCMHPVIRSSDRLALGAISGGTFDQREQLRARFMEKVRSTGLSIPDSRVTIHRDFILMYVPWSYRGEFRTVLCACAGSEASLGDSETSTLIGMVERHATEHTLIDHASFSSKLMEFGMAFDGPLRAVVRRMVSGDAHRIWTFPFGCTVTETGESSDLVWTIEFEDLEVLERAYALMGPLLSGMERLGSRLRPEYASAVLGDEVETLVPKLAVRCAGNSRQSRVEMARLLQNLILSLEKLSAGDVPDDLLS